jgi:hypothetical protein
MALRRVTHLCRFLLQRRNGIPDRAVTQAQLSSGFPLGAQPIYDLEEFELPRRGKLAKVFVYCHGFPLRT